MGEKPGEQYRRILQAHLPAGAVEWVYGYLDRHSIHLHITRRRRTKLGDYRRPQRGHPYHEISVNGDLGCPMFLWVLLHEMAHLETHLKWTHARPHGHEWQQEFATLLSAHSAWFPEEARPLIDAYSRRIPLSTVLARRIEAVLQGHEPGLTLDGQAAGVRFRLKSHPEKRFEAVQRRRTRWLCRCLDDGRQYLVSGAAEIMLEC